MEVIIFLKYIHFHKLKLLTLTKSILTYMYVINLNIGRRDILRSLQTELYYDWSNLTTQISTQTERFLYDQDNLTIRISIYRFFFTTRGISHTIFNVQIFLRLGQSYYTNFNVQISLSFMLLLNLRKCIPIYILIVFQEMKNKNTPQ